MKAGRDFQLFRPRKGLGTKAFLLLVASIALMAVDHHYNYLTGIRGALATIVYPVEWVVNAPTALSRTMAEEFASHQTLLHENRKLHASLIQARAKLLRLRSLQRENTRLRKLLHASGEIPGHVEVAGILSVDLDPFAHRITLNTGSTRGAHLGQPILDAYGIVGQIIHVSPITSQVMLITDPASAIPVEINRNGLTTLAVGTGDIDALSLPYLPNNANIKVGDLLVTSGLGGRYPRGYPVARVTAVAPQPGARFAQVTATPLAHLGRDHEVLLYFGHSKQASRRHLRGQ